MHHSAEINVKSILKEHKQKVGFTWLMVAVENILMVLLPLFVGYCIDSLLTGQFTELYVLAAVLTSLVVVSVIRRLYDTRAYGAIRVEIGEKVDQQLQGSPITTRNARLTMSRELVDFLENDLPPLLTAIIQLAASVIILATFNIQLALSAATAALIMLLIYSCFHRQFIRLNAALNNQVERQVAVLSCIPFPGIRRYLEKLNRREIMISDAEAIVYGLIFLVLFGFVLINLWLTAQTASPTAGRVFSIVTYSLEFVEAAILLPVTLQTLSRLTEISQRLNTVPVTQAPNKNEVTPA